MALFEIEDQYLDQLRNAASGLPLRDASADFKRARDHEQFIQGVSQNPKHRQKLLELIADTGTYVPEIEATKPLHGSIESLSKKFDDYVAAEEERRKKEAEERTSKSTEELIGKGRSYLRQQGWDDKGVEEVETFMRDNAVGSYEVASNYLRKQKESDSPTPLPSQTWNGGRDLGSAWFHPEDGADDAERHKTLLENPQAFTRNEINRFFKEKREGTLRLPS